LKKTLRVISHGTLLAFFDVECWLKCYLEACYGR
jgi:hypothetical protein